MGRAPCCSKVGLHRGPWTPREDTLLVKYIQAHGEGNWRSLPKKAGLLRCGKSCRLRWMNYLRPDIKRGDITADEDDLIIRMHSLLGNRWSLIAGRLPGRTDNEIKNYWNTHLSKKLRSQGTDPKTHKRLANPVQKEGKTRKSSKKKSTTGNKIDDTNKLKAEHKTTVKIHLPKPVRVTALSLVRHDSFESNNISSTQSSSQGGEQDAEDLAAANIDIIPWNDGDDDKGINFLIGDIDDNHALVNTLDFDCQKLVPTEDNNLEKLYEEYLELLKIDDDQNKLDSFAQSLLLEKECSTT